MFCSLQKGRVTNLFTDFTNGSFVIRFTVFHRYEQKDSQQQENRCKYNQFSKKIKKNPKASDLGTVRWKENDLVLMEKFLTKSNSLLLVS